ncbi:MAG: ammonia-forming cytochrome c nitrite reductase subunit c552 [Anaerolineales bacterium]|nr:ammonia-forming cytochrome c nitrite reductase subunit c552 [Anaerolineales bacterium]
MKNKLSSTVILTGIILLLAATLVATFAYLGNQKPQTRGIAPLIDIAALEPDSSLWGQNFPNQYSTYLQTLTNNARTNYGGSEPFSKLEADPRLVQLFAGYGFSKDYNEERGHANALTDVQATLRVNEKTPGTCYSCKAATNPKLWNEMGLETFDSTPFADMTQHMTDPIGCANCHDAETMELVVTNPSLDIALKAQGIDWTTLSRQEMRTLVCANCHVEYYFAGDQKILTFPWTGGTTIEAISQYYIDVGFKDWDHPESGAPMIKMQHPEYEFYTADSTHFNAGVACADCHMPYTRDGSAKFSNHNVQSPLLNAQAACGACHTDVDYVVDRVNIIQDTVWATMETTEDALVAAIDTIEAAAATPGVDETLLAEARDFHREAQLRWDFIAAENSMGFHNPEEALRILADAINLAYQGQLKALEAAGGTVDIQTSQQ